MQAGGSSGKQGGTGKAKGGLTSDLDICWLQRQAIGYMTLGG